MSTKINFWYPDRQYLAHKEEFDAEMRRVLKAGDLILREDVDKFEEGLAKFLGVKNVVSCASGTDALILSLKALGVGAGDEVITTSYTFRATVEAIHHTGATPVLVDMGEDWRVAKTSKTKAIIPAHLEGDVMDWEPDEGTLMVEDACQAIGAAPVRGDTACYSFYPAKILGCLGDGGAIATDNTELADHLRKMRNHYKDDWGRGYGYNSRLDNIQAAVLNVKLKYLPSYIQRRKEVAQMYDRGLLGVGVVPVRDVYQDYVVTHPEAEKLQSFLEEKGVQAMRNQYPFPDDLQKRPVATSYEANSLRLPCTPEHLDSEIEYVIKAVNSYGK